MDSETAMFYVQLSVYVSHFEVLIKSLFVGHKCRVIRARKGHGNTPETD